MSETLTTREAPGGILEVLDEDGVWRPVPHAAAVFIRNRNAASGFSMWEWMIGQVYAAGLVPSNRTSPDHNDETKIARDFMRACEARFPDQCQKFADYMGWERRVKTMDQPND